MLTESRALIEGKEEAGVGGAIVGVVAALILIAVFVAAAVHFGYTWSSFVSAFQKFFGGA